MIPRLVEFGVATERKKKTPMKVVVVAMIELGASPSLPTFLFLFSPSGLCQPDLNACRLLARVEGNGSSWRR
jgi:hypothetical protein